jgi:hypothetical protein
MVDLEPAQLFARLFFRLLDGEEQFALVGVQRFEVDAHVPEVAGVLQVDDVGNDRQPRAIAFPAVPRGLQLAAGERRRDAERGGQVGRHLQVQHLLDEDAENDVERLFVGAARCGAGSHPGPFASLVIIEAL